MKCGFKNKKDLLELESQLIEGYVGNINRVNNLKVLIFEFILLSLYFGQEEIYIVGY